MIEITQYMLPLDKSEYHYNFAIYISEENKTSEKGYSWEGRHIIEKTDSGSEFVNFRAVTK
jgi:hypothetical protein